MTFYDIVKNVEKIVADNSPAILTAIGVTGTLATAYFTGTASFKAAEIIQNREKEDGYPVEPKERLKTRTKLIWKLYIPAVGTGVLTVACIVCANRIGTRRAAAMAAAYSISERALFEYKEKVIEKFGENKDRAVRDDIAQDRVNKNPISTREVIITGNGDVLCYDTITGRYFESNVETLRKAQNDINQQILTNMYASLWDFYELIGLPSTAYSNEVGWNTDTLLDLDFSTVLSEDKRPCVSINYTVFPIRDYYRLR